MNELRADVPSRDLEASTSLPNAASKSSTKVPQDGIRISSILGWGKAWALGGHHRVTVRSDIRRKEPYKLNEKAL